MTIQMMTHGRVTWVNIVHPTPADVNELHQLYPYIHPLNLEDVQSHMERPKIDEDQDYLFIVMHFPQWDAQKSLSRPRELDIFVGRGYVVTIHDGVLRPLVNLWNACERDEEQRERTLGRGANYTFYQIIDQLVDYTLPILRKVDGNIRRIEEDIFTSETREIIREIALVRRDIIALRRIIRQQVPIIERLERAEHPIIHDDLEEYFGDVADHLYKARDIVDENFEVINSLADTADTLATHRINEVMRILTVISVVMLPLTLLTSFYGMNVPLPGQPEFSLSDEPFWALTIGMVLIGLGLLLYFRRRGWL
ncbi:MAG: magnesium transporter CorA family protein [Anaerolineae bacterium]